MAQDESEQQDDQQIERQKLAAVSRYVEMFETHVNRLRGLACVEQVRQMQRVDGSALAWLLREMEAVVGQGYSRSAFEADVAVIRARLDKPYYAQMERLSREVVRRLDQLAKWERGHAGDFASRVVVLVETVVALMDLALAPYRILQRELSRAVTSADDMVARETPGQMRRRIRNERIIELARLHGTESPTALVQLGRRDPLIQALAREAFTVETVRNVLRPRAPRKGF